MAEKENGDKAVDAMTALRVEQTNRYSPLFDVVTVDRKTRSIKHEGKTLTIASTEKDKRNSQIEAAIEIIMNVKKANEQRLLSKTNGKQQLASDMTASCGLVLNPETISLGIDSIENADDFISVGRVLGKGNCSGEVIVVKDKVTEKEVAVKTILVSHFNDDEIRAWIRLGDEDKAPELYHFRLIDGKVEVSMEPLTGHTMEQVTDLWVQMYQQDSSIAEKLSLCVLDDLLGIHDKLKPFSHGDIHAGNVFLENSMTVKLIDFGKARNLIRLSSLDRGMALRNDLVGIIRIFCALYSGVDFNDIWDAKKQLAANDLSQLNANIQHISEASRKDLFKIMSMLYDTVRDSNSNQEGFGDTSLVATHIKTLLPRDIENFKKKVAVILFPEKYQIQVDGTDSMNDHTIDDDSDILVWDSPFMDYCLTKITFKDLQKLDATSFFF